jgi:lipoate-protein ligase A
LASPQSLFDVERFRAEPRRLAVSPQVERPTLVLGSTQPLELVARGPASQRGVDVVRRRGGGGAVYLEPGDHLWVDAWIPRDDPLWVPDVAVAAEWVGAWWVDALSGLGAGLPALEVHTGRSVPGALGDLVCFAGRGPGEVFCGGRKVVGLSQWRGREGALFSSCAYARWAPAPMTELLDVGESAREELDRQLGSLAFGVSELAPGVDDLGRLRGALLSTIGAWPPSGG